MTQFSGHSDNQDLVSYVGDATGISTTAEIKQITRAINKANKRIWSWIFEAYGGWVFDDSNNSDLPTATADLVADQSKYTLPSEALTIRGVEIKIESGDTWHKMWLLPEERLRQFLSEKEFHDESSQPLYYTPYAGLIKLHPAPSYSQAASLRLSFDRGSVSFLSTDVSKSPGFASEFHEAVAVGASYYIATNKGLSNWEALREEWGDMPEGVPDRGFKKAIQEYYSQRMAERSAPIIDQGHRNIIREIM